MMVLENNWQEAMELIHLTNSSSFTDELYSNRHMMALSEHLHLEDAGSISKEHGSSSVILFAAYYAVKCD